MQRKAGANPQIVGSQFGAEVDSFLAIGPARSQLTVHGKVAAPRAPAMRHRDRHLLFERRIEELTRERHQARGQGRGDSVARDVEKSELAARLVESRANAGEVASIAAQ